MKKNNIFILYGLILLCFTAFSYLFVDQNLTYLHFLYTGFSSLNRLLSSVIYISIILILFYFYIIFLRLLNDNKLNIRDLKVLIIITVSILVFSYPAMLSYDIFNYITTAKVAYYYGENPYVIMPIEFKGEPFLLFTHAANKIALYGPAWILLSAIPYNLGFGNFIFTLLSFKLFNVIFYLGTVYLIWLFSKNLFSTGFFALNPLVIIETFASNHNDIVMMFFALLAYLLISNKKILLGLTIFVLSILIKYATLFLAPVYLYLIWQVIKNKKVSKEKIFSLSAISMFLIFLLAHFREEIYPWYAVWFLVYAAINADFFKKRFLFLVGIFCFSLLLRYVPFMLWGTHFGITPAVKAGLTFVPSFLAIIYLFVSKNLCLKKRYS